MATIKEIALLAGVSRGTVDRVLNNRGLVSPEKEKIVLDIVKAVNYMPNIAGKSLAARKKTLKFGYLLFGSTEGNPFFSEVVSGIKKRASELKDYGVSVLIRYTDIDNAAEQVKGIDELLNHGISGLAITPINHPLVIERLKELTDKGFPLVTVNTDIPHCGRMAYVGSDYIKSGEVAAGMMNLICAGKANVGVITGSRLVLCHTERIAGFTRRIEQEYKGIRIIGEAENSDDDIESYIVTKSLLERHPEIDALYFVAAGVAGACRAVTEMGLMGKIKIVGYDVTSASKKLIKSGEITVVITQEPQVQGAKPLDILLGRVGMNIHPEKDIFHTSLGIFIKDNL
ncbi:MAG: LacI family DNA-binding transcriptional regulator [Clostridiales bacterium]|jgi:LacI family transcriptional regulator|nr:LacI family DNA-binding transcriptional regulator [Clostridiales bacterium]